MEGATNLWPPTEKQNLDPTKNERHTYSFSPDQGVSGQSEDSVKTTQGS